MSTGQEIGKGYDFAYFAWMRLSTSSYRAEAAQKGITFFRLFDSINRGFA